MRARLKQIGVLLLAVLLLAFLVTGAHGTADKSLPADEKVKNPDQAVGKNWDVKGGTIKQKGKPQPIKTLKDAADDNSDTKSKLTPQPSTDKGLEPVNSID